MKKIKIDHKKRFSLNLYIKLFTIKNESLFSNESSYKYKNEAWDCVI